MHAYESYKDKPTILEIIDDHHLGKFTRTHMRTFQLPQNFTTYMIFKLLDFFVAKKYIKIKH